MITILIIWNRCIAAGSDEKQVGQRPLGIEFGHPWFRGFMHQLRVPGEAFRGSRQLVQPPGKPPKQPECGSWVLCLHRRSQQRVRWFLPQAFWYSLTPLFLFPGISGEKTGKLRLYFCYTKILCEIPLPPPFEKISVETGLVPLWKWNKYHHGILSHPSRCINYVLKKQLCVTEIIDCKCFFFL